MNTSTVKQQTIAQTVHLSGKGLFSGHPVNVAFKPAPDDHGIVFVRTDIPGSRPIPALVAHVARRPRRTALRVGEATVETVEHCLSALVGLGIDNLLIELDGPELPGVDGSSLPFVNLLQAAGIQAGNQPRRILVLDEPVEVRIEDMVLAAVPTPQAGMQVLYELEYPQPVIGRQLRTFDLGREDYVKEIAPARTFVLEHEAAALRAAGMGLHLTPMDVLVLGKDGPVGGNVKRFSDEPVRHKILDLIGDLYLLGAPLQARVIAIKSGHNLNHMLVRALTDKLRKQIQETKALRPGLLDVRKILTALPHRYPFLLIDRVLELDPGVRILGVKNVTINEPFFQGHFPQVPMMPGVLIIEAMAQAAGVLVRQMPENIHQERLGILMALDRVKLRRPVVPGDQLILEAETVRIRSALAHMRCRAYVGEDLAAEAEIKFMLVPKDSI